MAATLRESYGLSPYVQFSSFSRAILVPPYSGFNGMDGIIKWTVKGGF